MLETLVNKGSVDIGFADIHYKVSASPFGTKAACVQYFSEEPSENFSYTYIEMPEVPERKNVEFQTYAIARDCKYGTDILETFDAPDWDSAVDYAIAYCIPALEAALEEGPLEEWYDEDEISISVPHGDDSVACGIDPENVAGFIAESTYIDLKLVGPCKSKTPMVPELSDREKELVGIVRNSEIPTTSLIEALSGGSLKMI